MLQVIWKHYKYSCKAFRELKGLAELMDERAYKAVKADGSRWIPHLERALNMLLTKNYKFNTAGKKSRYDHQIRQFTM